MCPKSDVERIEDVGNQEVCYQGDERWEEKSL